VTADPLGLGPWARIGLVLLAAGAWLGCAVLVRRAFAPSGETMRKMIHITVTILALSFPWLFPEAWPPPVLAGITIVLMGLSRVPAFGGVVDAFGMGDARRLNSWGEFYHPFAIGTLFLLARHEPGVYAVPVIAVGFGDAAAAVIGAAWGRIRYPALSGELKSLEGSLAFAAVSFAGGYAALVGWAGLPPPDAALLAAAAGAYMSLLEGMAWHGLDNLLVPFGGLLIIRLLQGTGGPILLAHAVGVLAAAGLAAAILARRAAPASGRRDAGEASRR
jgi:phytol kinase